jgi:hypothetical protein
MPKSKYTDLTWYVLLILRVAIIVLLINIISLFI